MPEKADCSKCVHGRVGYNRFTEKYVAWCSAGCVECRSTVAEYAVLANPVEDYSIECSNFVKRGSKMPKEQRMRLIEAILQYKSPPPPPSPPEHAASYYNYWVWRKFGEFDAYIGEFRYRWHWYWSDYIRDYVPDEDIQEAYNRLKNYYGE